jgi:hypothetical protein
MIRHQFAYQSPQVGWLLAAARHNTHRRAYPGSKNYAAKSELADIGLEIGGGPGSRTLPKHVYLFAAGRPN